MEALVVAQGMGLSVYCANRAEKTFFPQMVLHACDGIWKQFSTDVEQVAENHQKEKFAKMNFF